MDKHMTCKEIFEKVNSRQSEAVNFHCQMASLFDFLGLEGFKCMHDYMYLKESIEQMRIKKMYMDHHQKLLKDGEASHEKYIDEEWYGFSKCEVPTNVREKSVKDAMEQYKSWEEETKEFYEECAKHLMEDGCMFEHSIVSELIKDVTDELRWINKLNTELSGVGYDSEYIFGLQEKYEKMYEGKIDKLHTKVKSMYDKEWEEYKEPEKHLEHHESKIKQDDKKKYKIGMNY